MANVNDKIPEFMEARYGLDPDRLYELDSIVINAIHNSTIEHAFDGILTSTKDFTREEIMCWLCRLTAVTMTGLSNTNPIFTSLYFGRIMHAQKKGNIKKDNPETK